MYCVRVCVCVCVRARVCVCVCERACGEKPSNSHLNTYTHIAKTHTHTKIDDVCNDGDGGGEDRGGEGGEVLS